MIKRLLRNKYTIGVVVACLLLASVLVTYKQQADENARQNDRLEQVVTDLADVVAEQDELRVANDKATCESGNRTRATISDTFRNVVNALIQASADPERAAATFIPPLEEQLAKLAPRDCDALDVGNVPEVIPPAIPSGVG